MEMALIGLLRGLRFRQDNSPSPAENVNPSFMMRQLLLPTVNNSHVSSIGTMALRSLITCVIAGIDYLVHPQILVSPPLNRLLSLRTSLGFEETQLF